MVEHNVSIAEARANLPGLVREAEEGAAVQITRWGTPVAVLVSAACYQQLTHGRPAFGAALDALLEQVEMSELQLDPGDLQNLRDRATGREPRW